MTKTELENVFEDEIPLRQHYCWNRRVFKSGITCVLSNDSIKTDQDYHSRQVLQKKRKIAKVFCINTRQIMTAMQEVMLYDE